MTYSETQTSFSQAAAAEFDTGDQSPHLQEPEEAPKVDAQQADVPVTPAVPELFVVEVPAEMPDFSQKRRARYPFADMTAKSRFCAGKLDKALRNRVYVAVAARKKAHPAEGYDYQYTADGLMYVWRIA